MMHYKSYLHDLKAGQEGRDFDPSAAWKNLDQ